MNLEVEREVGELAKLRRLRDALAGVHRWTQFGAAHHEPEQKWIRADDLDEALKEVGGE